MEELDITIEELYPEAKEITSINNDLRQLQRSKPERLKIIFSEIMENTFFAEMLLSQKRRFYIPIGHIWTQLCIYVHN